MINRIFFISDKAILSGDPLPAEENIYYSVPADPRIKGSLEEAYALVAQGRHSPLSLTLSIREPLTGENRRFITSFLFIPSYLTLDYRPVIGLRGTDPDLLRAEAASLSADLSLQGIREPILQLIAEEEPDAGVFFRSVPALTLYYRDLLRSSRSDGQGSDKHVFFVAPSADILRSAVLSLQQAEMDLEREAPSWYSLIRANSLLEKELRLLRRELDSTDAELGHQLQYVAVLRSHHATKELQDYYTREYEILPLWYKRLGHILKVLTGKRTFQSLFRDDVKKYKD